MNRIVAILHLFSLIREDLTTDVIILHLTQSNNFPRKKMPGGICQTYDTLILSGHQLGNPRNCIWRLRGSVFPLTDANFLMSLCLCLFSPLQKEDTILSFSTQCCKACPIVTLNHIWCIQVQDTQNALAGRLLLYGRNVLSTHSYSLKCTDYSDFLFFAHWNTKYNSGLNILV